MHFTLAPNIMIFKAVVYIQAAEDPFNRRAFVIYPIKFHARASNRKKRAWVKITFHPHDTTIRFVFAASPIAFAFIYMIMGGYRAPPFLTVTVLFVTIVNHLSPFTALVTIAI